MLGLKSSVVLHIISHIRYDWKHNNHGLMGNVNQHKLSISTCYWTNLFSLIQSEKITILGCADKNF